MAFQKIHNRTIKEDFVGDERMRTTPRVTTRSLRMDEVRVVTSTPAGMYTPVYYAPVLREDAVRTSRVRVAVEMDETADMLLNAVEIKAHAWFVPRTAMERFRGEMAVLNRSYAGIPEVDGNVVPVWQAVDWLNFDTTTEPRPIFKTLGLHKPKSGYVNRDIPEAYNIIWNWEAQRRSESINQRGGSSRSLAPAFWDHNDFKYIKERFDQALLHGELPLEITDGRMKVGTDGAVGSNLGIDIDGTQHGMNLNNNLVSAAGPLPGASELFAELEQNGITVSLANMEMAKKTAAFARMRQQYRGQANNVDDYIIDLLMQGLKVPELMMRQPILLDSKRTIVGMSQQWASDGASLGQSATRGKTAVDLTIRVPRTPSGGIIMICVETVPEQIFERKEDCFANFTEPQEGGYGQETLPNNLRDSLNVEPVEVVENAYVDVAHSDPGGVFGYAPLNHRWNRTGAKVGGKYMRIDPNAPWNENRNRIWANEAVDPTLGSDFYTAQNIHQEVFMDTEADPFEITCRGMLNLEGDTVFGPGLYESQDDYEIMQEQVDYTRIDLPDEADPTEAAE